MLVICSFTAVVYAQRGLQVEQVFQRFSHEKCCSMVALHHPRIRGYQLEVYKALTYSCMASSIEAYLKKDRQQAKKIKEVIQGGKVTCGYYMMQPIKGKINRYILFAKGKNNGGTVIYIEGCLLPDDVMKLCYKK